MFIIHNLFTFYKPLHNTIRQVNSACRFSEKESNFGFDGSLVQHGGAYDSKGVPAMLERLYKLPEGKKNNFVAHHE